MQQLFQKTTFITFLFVGISVHGMEIEREYQIPILFAQALMRADRAGNIDWLQQFVEAGEGLSELCPYSGRYPLADIISQRYDSSLITIGLRNGARVDLRDRNRKTLFHWIARCLAVKGNMESYYFPKKNLLSALALPTHQYPLEQVVSEEEKLVSEAKFKALKKSIKIFFLCVNRPEYQTLKNVRYIILAHMQGECNRDGIYCERMFGRVIDYVSDPKKLVAQSPFEWFQSLTKLRTRDERAKFTQKFAPLIARYRLEKALEVTNTKDMNNDTAQELAIMAALMVEELVNMGLGSSESARKAREIADMLEPIGFIERHMPDCTKIIMNLLENKDPFDGILIE